MRRFSTRSRLTLSLGLLASAIPVASARAQEGPAGTPSAADDPATPAASDTVWFVIAPDGKGNGDFFDVTLAAGEQATMRGTLGNGSAIPVKAIIYAADAYSGVNGGFMLNGADAEVTAPTTWLDFPTITYDFQPAETFETAFTVAVPDDTPPGQYITGVAIETAEAEPMKGGAPLMVKYRLAAPVLVTVPGPVTPAFDIGDIGITISETTTIITGMIENTGNIRVRPAGTLRISDEGGSQLVDAPIAMGSVYAGDTTTFEVILPTPLSEGTYLVSVDLADDDTGATAVRSDVAVDVARQEAPAPVSITSASFTPMPSTEDIVFVQVAITITNTGAPIAGGEITLQVLRDGEPIDEVTLASAMTLQTGDTVIEQPYLPASGSWEAGAYTFRVTVSATDLTTGTSSTITTLTSEDTLDIS